LGNSESRARSLVLRLVQSANLIFEENQIAINPPEPIKFVLAGLEIATE
jgi:hypothetical protein